MVEILVDLDSAENKDPKQELDEGEHIRVYTVSSKDLLKTLKLMCKNHEYEVDARLWSLAFGLSKNKSRLVKESNNLLQNWDWTHSLAVSVSVVLTATIVLALCSSSKNANRRE